MEPGTIGGGSQERAKDDRETQSLSCTKNSISRRLLLTALPGSSPFPAPMAHRAAASTPVPTPQPQRQSLGGTRRALCSEAGDGCWSGHGSRGAL